MEVVFQVLDCDYVNIDNRPVVRIFGKTKNGETVCAFYDKFLPYFYVLPIWERKDELIDFIKKRFSRDVVKIEPVKKYLPIYFQKEKTDLLKITLKDPSQTPVIRDILRSQPFISNIYEADILFRYRFMVDFGISGMKWVKVSGVATNTTTVKTERKITVSKIEPIEDNSNVELKYMSVDIEIAANSEMSPPDATKDGISLISVSFSPHFNGEKTQVFVAKPIKTSGNVLAFQNEKSMLEEFINIIDRYDPDVITGYNINNFDIPYLVERLKRNKITRAVGRCQSKQIISKKFGIRYSNIIAGRIIADVYELVKDYVGKGMLRLKRYGLGDVSKELLDEGKIDISHSEIGKYWNGDSEKFDKLIDYARKDAELALDLLIKRSMIDKFFELSKVSGVLLQDVLNGGESVRVENLLLKEFNRLDYVIPLKPTDQIVFSRQDEREVEGLKGALVLEPAIGLHTNIVYLDFKSMYPSIFITYNICPSTLTNETDVKTTITPYGARFVSADVRRGIIPQILVSLIKDRDKVKKEMYGCKNEIEFKALDAKQYALKIMANAFYGYMGYIRARLYVLDIANAITSCGRYLIQKTSEIIEKNRDYKVVYGDTDSVMVKLQTKSLEDAFIAGQEIEELVNKEHGGAVKIKIESIFKTILILSKKRYAGLSCEKKDGEWKEKIVMKGIETVRRDWCDLVSESLYRTLEIILKEQTPKKALEYIKSIIRMIDRNEVPVEKLVVTKSISKSLKDYKGIQPHIELVKKLRKRNPATAPGLGDRVGFVIIKGLQLMSDRAEDPEYVKRNNLKIDSKYYIESQLLPPLERVFEAMGVDRSELLGAGKQMLLIDAIRNGTKKPNTVDFLSSDQFDGFACVMCDQKFRRMPLMGKCNICGGEILFSHNELKSKNLNFT